MFGYLVDDFQCIPMFCYNLFADTPGAKGTGFRYLKDNG